MPPGHEEPGGGALPRLPPGTQEVLRILRYGPDDWHQRREAVLRAADDERRRRGDARLLRDIAEVCCPTCGRDDGEPDECRRCGATICTHCTYRRNGLRVCPECYMILRYQGRGRRGNVIDLPYHRRVRRGKAPCSA